MSVSTSEPMPLFIASVTFDTNSDCFSIRAADAPNAAAPSTAVWIRSSISLIEPSAAVEEDTSTFVRSRLDSKLTDDTVMLDEETSPAESRSSEDRTVMSPPSLFSRFAPLNCEAEMIEVIWFFSSVTSASSLSLSTFSPVAATTFSFISFRSPVICSAPASATATVDSPSARESDTALKPDTSDSITLEIAQIAELSLAVAISLPVEIAFWVLSRLLLMVFRVCSATIAPLLVRMLVIAYIPLAKRHFGL